MSSRSLSIETIKGTLFLGSWGTISKVLAIINSFIIIYLLSVYEYGLYALVLSIVSITEIVLFENMDQMIINDMLIEKSRDNLVKAKKIYQEYFLYKAIFGLLGFIALFCGAEAIAIYAGYVSISLFVKIGAFLVLIRTMLNFIRVNLTLSKKFFQLGRHTFIQEFFKIIILGAIFIFFQPGIAKIIFAMFLANFCAIVITISKNLNDFKFWLSGFSFDLSKSELWKILKAHGKWNALENIVANFQKNISIWLVKLFISTEAVGIFNFGKNLYKQLDELLPINKVMSQFLPEISSDKNRMQRVFIYGTKYYTFFSILIGVTGIIALPIFVYLIFPKYILSIPVFLIFMIIPLSYGGAFKICNLILFTLRQQKFLSYMLILRTFSVVILNSIFLPIFGVIGVAMERVITLFISTVIINFKTTQLLNLKWYAYVRLFKYESFDSKFLSSFINKFKSKFKKS